MIINGHELVKGYFSFTLDPHNEHSVILEVKEHGLRLSVGDRVMYLYDGIVATGYVSVVEDHLTSVLYKISGTEDVAYL